MLNLLTIADPPRYQASVPHQPVSGQKEACRDPGNCNSATCAALEYSLLQDVGQLKTFKKDDVIFWDGEPNGSVYFIVSGVIRGTKLSCDGRRLVTRFAFSGEMLEYVHLPYMPFTAEAVTSVTARAIPRPILEEAMSTTPCLRQLVMQSILDELHETQCRVTSLARLTAHERVAQFLHNICLRSGVDRDGAFELPMPRQDIADYLGLTIETVSRVLSKLKRENKIRLLSSSRVVIPNLPEFTDELLANAA